MRGKRQPRGHKDDQRPYFASPVGYPQYPGMYDSSRMPPAAYPGMQYYPPPQRYPGMPAMYGPPGNYMQPYPVSTGPLRTESDTVLAKPDPPVPKGPVPVLVLNLRTKEEQDLLKMTANVLFTMELNSWNNSWNRD